MNVTGENAEKGQLPQEKAPWLTSCRLMTAIVGMFGTISLYMMRANMSVAIVCMTQGENTTEPVEGQNDTTNYTHHGVLGDAALWNNMPGIQSVDLRTASREPEFDWDRQLQSWVQSSFFIAYMVTQFPGGWLAGVFRPKIIIITSIGSLSILTLLTPVAARASVYLLMAVQAMKGLSSGLYYPAFYQLFGRWTTHEDRSILMSVFSSGASSGAIISSLLSGALCDHGFDGGWPSIFYVMGITGCIWCIVWLFMGFDSPSEHPRISQSEVDYIHNLTPPNQEKIKMLDAPWRDMLMSLPFWALIVMEMTQGWNWYVALTTLPQFMKDVLKFDMTQNGLYNALPYIANASFAFTMSSIADVILKRKLIGVTHTRKLFQSLGMVPCALFSIGVAFVPVGQTGLVVALVTFWVGFQGFKFSGSISNTVELAPRFAGLVMGVQNIFGNLPGVIAPPAVAAMTPQGSRAQWQNVFILNAIIVTSGLIFYIIFGDSTEQEWAKVYNEKEDKSDNFDSTVSYRNEAYDEHNYDGIYNPGISEKETGDNFKH